MSVRNKPGEGTGGDGWLPAWDSCSRYYTDGMDAAVGVYVHVPFCVHVCPYCDFAVEATPRQSAQEAWQSLEERYVDALIAELRARAPVFSGRVLASLYFGGGTPSLLRPDSLARIREAVFAEFEAVGPVEVTLEVNPSTLERDRLPAFRGESGVNRLSIGVQSFDDSLLKALGRAHAGDECHRTLAAAREAGFDNVSVDLMFAALHQTPAMLDADLDQLEAFAPEHISTYELVLEEHTPFGLAAAEGRMHAYPSDECAEMMERIATRLGQAGYARYELTSYAREGFEAVHNQRYWSREPVLGLGVGAHSTDPPAPDRPFGARLANPRGREEWLRRIVEGRAAAEHEEVLTRDDALGEAFFLSLRRVRGLRCADLLAEFGAPPRALFPDEIEALCSRGLLHEDPDGDLRLSPRGRMLADEVFSHFVRVPSD
jgi:oxygen-independent coproporphyrinogen-3 oxidase